MSGIRITITVTSGSVPREAGTSMMVWPDRIQGTIGGGALEWQAMQRARQMLDDGRAHLSETIPLGPALGQCCGGSVSLCFEQAAAEATPTGAPLWIYGAGHVGRALVQVLSPLPDFDVTWVDTSMDRFPDDLPPDVSPLAAEDPTAVVRHAPDTAHHLILTYSHQIDLALCHAVLSQPFASAGLIGSATKWARFRKRLRDLGHGQAQIARIACPIGDTRLGKHPQAIAIGVAMAMLGQGHAAGAEGTG